MSPSRGAKIYGLDWPEETGLSIEQAVATLVSQGIEFVVLNNAIDAPVAHTPDAVAEPRLGEATLQDVEFRAGLRDAGIRFYEVFPVFMDGGLWNDDPSIRPIDSDGSEMVPFDWYVGLCPTHPGRRADRTLTITRVVEQLRPDGILLDWIRFPGFWERWVPSVDLTSEPDYCHCHRCLDAFMSTSGGASPADDPVGWISWKQATIASACMDLAGAARAAAPGTEVIANMVGFPADEPGDPVGRLLGQSFEALEPHVDGFAIMLYHQMIDRDPVALADAVLTDALGRTDKPLLPCIQLAATYTDGPYAAAGRSPVVPPGEYRAAIEAVSAHDPVGVLLYRWQDLLAHSP